MNNHDPWPKNYGLNTDYQEPDTLEILMDKHDLSVSTLASVLGCSQLAIWKMERGIREIPALYEKKLQRFLAHLESKRHSD